MPYARGRQHSLLYMPANRLEGMNVSSRDDTIKLIGLDHSVSDTLTDRQP